MRPGTAWGTLRRRQSVGAGLQRAQSFGNYNFPRCQARSQIAPRPWHRPFSGPDSSPLLSPLTTSDTRPAHRDTAMVLQGIGLSCQRGDRALFSGLEMALAPGSVTWLRGRNGRGKTSLLRLLAGLSTPMAGEICVVETVADLWAMERAGIYRGRYHVLGGVLSALRDDKHVPLHQMHHAHLLQRCAGHARGFELQAFDQHKIKMQRGADHQPRECPDRQ